MLPNKVFRFIQPTLINGSFRGDCLEGNPPHFCDLSTFCRTSTELLFLKGNSPIKLAITSDFITQSQLLGGSIG
ncbi:MAG: hypothetical protein DWQ51_01010 [Microcystis wesenbergii TW10]|uniref:Mobile element protein n=3 Tax=Microcystis TaxID=1125 RepID=A0A0A1VTR1_MICAE|nr:MAG: hypothetical protein DWQ51_01010 [Microcystis wesenbergii TW10]TRT81715.1 MAG: hypothetical protein EWV63_21405 [Microcystis aeruginosa Ma_OC_H_19870700_S124]GAL93115.1 mobile element protein [Microcystis aeruginosa NIES-44]